MTKIYLSILAAVFVIAGLPAVSQSEMITKTFVGTVVSGPLKGEFGFGSFTFEDDLLIHGNETLDPADGLLVAFSFDGQDFSQINDSDFDSDPTLHFTNFIPVELKYLLRDGINGVNFKDYRLIELETSKLFPTVEKPNFDTDLYTVTVPIPGALWLLGSGMAGLLGLRVRARYHA